VTAENLRSRDLLLANAYDLHEQAAAQLKLVVAKRKKQFIAAELYHDLRLSVFGSKRLRDRFPRQKRIKIVRVLKRMSALGTSPRTWSRTTWTDRRKQPNGETSSRWDIQEGDSRSSSYGEGKT